MPVPKATRMEAELRSRSTGQKKMVWVRTFFSNFAPSLRLYTQEEAQMLVNALAEIGIRPK